MFLSPSYMQQAEARWPQLASFAQGSAGEKSFTNILRATVTTGVAGTMSYMNARHAQPGRQAYEIAGVPADLALGLMFAGLATFTSYFGKQHEHVLDVGNGFLAAYACRMGTVWGGAARAQLGSPAQARGQFAPPQPSYQSQEAVAAPYPWAA